MPAELTAPSTINLPKILPGLAAIAHWCNAVMAWEEEEIAAAQRRHGEVGRGALWNSFLLLVPHLTELNHEPLYRAHCRELLDRVAAGEDTRPGTDAEILAALVAASKAVPLAAPLACLFYRLFARRLPHLEIFGDTDLDPLSYEKVHGGEADDHEAVLRRKLTRKDRVPKPRSEWATPGEFLAAS